MPFSIVFSIDPLISLIVHRNESEHSVAYDALAIGYDNIREKDGNIVWKVVWGANRESFFGVGDKPIL